MSSVPPLKDVGKSFATILRWLREISSWAFLVTIFVALIGIALGWNGLRPIYERMPTVVSEIILVHTPSPLYEDGPKSYLVPENPHPVTRHPRPVTLLTLPSNLISCGTAKRAIAAWSEIIQTDIKDLYINARVSDHGEIQVEASAGDRTGSASVEIYVLCSYVPPRVAIETPIGPFQIHRYEPRPK